MDDIFGRIVTIFLLIFAILYIPFSLHLQKTEAIKQASMETIVVEFVDDCRATGKISPEAYEKMYRDISELVEFADIKMTHSSKVTGYENGTVFDYFVDFNNQDILDVMYNSDPNENIDYKLRNGDYLTLVVKNTKPTLATRLSIGRRPTTSLYYPYSGMVGNYAENEE